MRFKIFAFLLYAISTAIGIFRTRMVFASIHQGGPVYDMVEHDVNIAIVALCIMIWIFWFIWMAFTLCCGKCRIKKCVIIAIGVIPITAVIVGDWYLWRLLEQTPAVVPELIITEHQHDQQPPEGTERRGVAH